MGWRGAGRIATRWEIQNVPIRFLHATSGLKVDGLTLKC